MKLKIEFLYCFDINYINQGYSSILSLLSNIDEKVVIHVIHNNSKIQKNLPTIISQHKQLDKIYFYKVDKNYNFYPNIENSHVSEATYFRLFMSELLPAKIKNLVYLDADTICISNPMSNLRIHFKELENSNYIVAAKTEEEKSKIKDFDTIHKNSYEIPFVRLPIDEKYFNAGVLCISYQKWIKNNTTKLLFENLEAFSEHLINWDQDVLNIVFNGEYIELSESLNQYDTEVDKHNILKRTEFLHYVGSKKPWNPSGIIRKNFNYYHFYFRKFNNQNFHIDHVWRKQSVFNLINSISNLSILNIDKPIKYIIEFLRSLKNEN